MIIINNWGGLESSGGHVGLGRDVLVGHKVCIDEYFIN
jgi:hypothetical protein